MKFFTTLRTSYTKTIENPVFFKKQLLHWANQHQEVVFLESNATENLSQKNQKYDFVLAVDAFTAIKTDYFKAFEDLQQYQKHSKDWLFGHLSYDLKNDTENLKSCNFDGLEFPDLYFFQPKKLFFFTDNVLEINYLHFCDDELETDLETIFQTVLFTENHSEIAIKQRVSKEDYVEKTTEILDHIHLGTIYEANFCMEFFAENATIDPLHVFEKLNAISEAPFSVFYKNDFHFLLSASPERYLQRQETKVISQPIKGTAKRNEDKTIDNQLKSELENNAKERSENIMIVDLVRNDLSKTATKGSVKVEELCQIYSFKQVHQLISTIVSEVEQSCSSIEIIKTTFPMGSMTGAPKIAAMQIIEELETTKRGVYSGAVGYFDPNGNFDFNVIIRSILYNAKKHYLSFSVGSAITSLSVPEQEYEECLLKAKAMFSVLQG